MQVMNMSYERGYKASFLFSFGYRFFVFGGKYIKCKIHCEAPQLRMAVPAIQKFIKMYRLCVWLTLVCDVYFICKTSYIKFIKI